MKMAPKNLAQVIPHKSIDVARKVLPHSSPLWVAFQTTGKILNFGQARDIQISGPGALEVAAGRNPDLGSGANNADGTGEGLTSIGNGRNPFLTFEGASIIAGLLSVSPRAFMAARSSVPRAKATSAFLRQRALSPWPPTPSKRATRSVFPRRKCGPKLLLEQLLHLAVDGFGEKYMASRLQHRTYRDECQ
jgi:hypothetical protein